MKNDLKLQDVDHEVKFFILTHEILTKESQKSGQPNEQNAADRQLVWI